jgi:hypothetical protein
MWNFTFENLKQQYEEVLTQGYKVLTCKEYCMHKANAQYDRVLVNRVDVDISPKRAEILSDIYSTLGIHATFFIRLHAFEYNAFSFENYRIFKKIRDAGHEVGYHSEIVDQANIWGEDPRDCLVRDIGVINQMLNIKIDGVASHGGITGLNNLDFWKNHKPGDFGLLYEAYDKEPEFNLFQESLYVSDSCWTHWKCYDNGQLAQDDRRSPAEHAADGKPVIAMLVHPETYYHKHIYE